MSMKSIISMFSLMLVVSAVGAVAKTRLAFDCGRKRREGSRGILNAFEIYFLAPIE